jgi:DNA-binding XRE family transcriptional regulator
MVTKELCRGYGNLSDEAQTALLALSVLTTRMLLLPKPDQDDLFTLWQALKDTKDEEDRKSIRVAMEEIVIQVPVELRAMDLPIEQRPLSTRRQAWAEHVGRKIKELRERAGLTQVKLAEMAGLPQSHISRLENAEYSATNMTIGKIATALGVAIGEIDPCAD